MTARQQQRRDTAANWTSVNPVLAEGEIGYETDTGRYKIGTGQPGDAWTTLPYAAPATPLPDNAGSVDPDNYASCNDAFFTGTLEAQAAVLVPADAADVPVTVRAAASQTGNLVEIQDDTSTAIVAVGPAGDLDVDAAVDVESQDAATSPVTIRAAASQTAALVKVLTDAGVDVLSVGADGTIIAGGATDGVVVSPSDSSVDLFKDATNSLQLRANQVGTTNSVLSLIAGGSTVASILGDGRIRKTVDGTTGDDVLRRSESDVRYQRRLTDSSGVVGQIKTFVSGAPNQATSFNLGSGTWVYAWFRMSSSSGTEFFTDSGVGSGTGSVSVIESGPPSTWFAIAYRIA